MLVFKNVIVYRIGAGWSATLAEIEERLAATRFVACGPSQEKSSGWVEPRGVAQGPLVESVAGQLVLKMMVETRALPASVVNRKAEERVAQIEATLAQIGAFRLGLERAGNRLNGFQPQGAAA
jgi:recombination associated protein RdgC